MRNPARGKKCVPHHNNYGSFWAATRACVQDDDCVGVYHDKTNTMGNNHHFCKAGTIKKILDSRHIVYRKYIKSVRGVIVTYNWKKLIAHILFEE